MGMGGAVHCAFDLRIEAECAYEKYHGERQVFEEIEYRIFFCFGSHFIVFNNFDVEETYLYFFLFFFSGTIYGERPRV